MKFRTRTVRCSATGLSQEQALESLYDHPNFDPSTMRITSIRQTGDVWVAKLKVAEFPPKDDGGNPFDGDEGPEPKEDDDGDEDGDTKPAPFADGDDEGGDKPKKKEKGGADLHEILHLLHEITKAMGIGGDEGGIPGADDGMGGPMGADVPPPMPPGGDMGGPPGGPHDLPGKNKPVKLEPGDVLPQQTPIGAPSFSSVQGNMGMAPTSTCAQCKGPVNPDGTCSNCQQHAPTQPATVSSIIGRVASFTATEVTDMTIKQAKAELESIYADKGYKVRQIREDHNAEGQRVLHALLSVK